MKVTRRTFVKSAVVGGGALAASRFLFGESEVLASQSADQKRSLAEEWLPTTCWLGKQDCGIIARRVNGRVVSLVGDPAHPRNKGTLCPKGVAQISAVYDPNRVKTPLIRTNEKGVPGQWREASWDEALGLVADKIKEVRAKDPTLIMWQKGRSKQEALYDTALVGSLGATKVGHGT